MSRKQQFEYREAQDKVRELLSMLSYSLEDKQGEIIRRLLTHLEDETKYIVENL